MALKPQFKPDFSKQHKSVIQIYKFENGIKGNLVHPLIIGDAPQENEHATQQEPLRAKSSN
nr:unnamed protein product [Callosobruchus chinensis]